MKSKLQCNNEKGAKCPERRTLLFPVPTESIISKKVRIYYSDKMSDIELTKMTSKGQIVIPLDIRREIHAETGTVFAVFGSRDMIMLKRILKPTKEELQKDWAKLTEEGEKKAKILGIKESDVDSIIHKRRGV